MIPKIIMFSEYKIANVSEMEFVYEELAGYWKEGIFQLVYVSVERLIANWADFKTKCCRICSVIFFSERYTSISHIDYEACSENIETLVFYPEHIDLHKHNSA